MLPCFTLVARILLYTPQVRTGAGRAAFRGAVASAGAEVSQATQQMSKMDIRAAHKREDARLLRILRYLDYDDTEFKPSSLRKLGES